MSSDKHEIFEGLAQEDYKIPDEYGMTQMIQKSIGCYAKCSIAGGGEVDGYIRYAGTEHLVLCSEQGDMHAVLRLESILCLCIWDQRKKASFDPPLPGHNPAERRAEYTVPIAQADSPQPRKPAEVPQTGPQHQRPNRGRRF